MTWGPGGGRGGSRGERGGFVAKTWLLNLVGKAARWGQAREELAMCADGPPGPAALQQLPVMCPRPAVVFQDLFWL